MLAFYAWRNYAELQCNEHIKATGTARCAAECAFNFKGLSAVERHILPLGSTGTHYFEDGTTLEERPPALVLANSLLTLVLAVSLAVSAFKVHQDFGWRSFSATNNDPQSRLRMRVYSVWRAMCKVDTVSVTSLLIIGNLLDLDRSGSSSTRWYFEWNLSLLVFGPLWQLPARRVLQSRSDKIISKVLVVVMLLWGILLLLYVGKMWHVLALESGDNGVLKRVWTKWVQAFLLICTVERTLLLCCFGVASKWLGKMFITAERAMGKADIQIESKLERLLGEHTQSVRHALRGSYLRVHRASYFSTRGAPPEIFLQLNRDCSALRWSWQQYILVEEIVRVTECSDPAMRHMWPANKSLWTVEMHTAAGETHESARGSSPSQQTLRSPRSSHRTSAGRTEGAPVSTQRLPRSPRTRRTSDQAVVKRFKAVDKLARSFCIEYAGGRRSGCKVMVLTCPGRMGCTRWVAALRVLLQTLHKLREAELLPGELEFVQQAFKQSDDGSGYLTVGAGGSIHKWLARLNTTMKAETSQRAQEVVLGAVLCRAGAPANLRLPWLLSCAYSTASVLASRLLYRARRAIGVSSGGEGAVARDHETVSVQQAVHFYCAAKRSLSLVELFNEHADCRSETGYPCMSKAAWLRLHLSTLEVDDDALDRVLSTAEELDAEPSSGLFAQLNRMVFGTDPWSPKQWSPKPWSPSLRLPKPAQNGGDKGEALRRAISLHKGPAKPSSLDSRSSLRRSSTDMHSPNPTTRSRCASTPERHSDTPASVWASLGAIIHPLRGAPEQYSEDTTASVRERLSGPSVISLRERGASAPERRSDPEGATITAWASPRVSMHPLRRSDGTSGSVRASLEAAISGSARNLRNMRSTKGSRSIAQACDPESPWELRGAQFETEVATLTRVFEQAAAEHAAFSGGRTVLSEGSFCAAMLDPASNGGLLQREEAVWQDMKQPLQNYLCNSSHNTCERPPFEPAGPIDLQSADPACSPRAWQTSRATSSPLGRRAPCTAASSSRAAAALSSTAGTATTARCRPSSTAQALHMHCTCTAHALHMHRTLHTARSHSARAPHVHRRRADRQARLHAYLGRERTRGASGDPRLRLRRLALPCGPLARDAPQPAAAGAPGCVPAHGLR